MIGRSRSAYGGPVLVDHASVLVDEEQLAVHPGRRGWPSLHDRDLDGPGHHATQARIGHPRRREHARPPLLQVRAQQVLALQAVHEREHLADREPIGPPDREPCDRERRGRQGPVADREDGERGEDARREPDRAPRHAPVPRAPAHDLRLRPAEPAIPGGRGCQHRRARAAAHDRPPVTPAGPRRAARIRSPTVPIEPAPSVITRSPGRARVATASGIASSGLTT